MRSKVLKIMWVAHRPRTRQRSLSRKRERVGVRAGCYAGSRTFSGGAPAPSPYPLPLAGEGSDRKRRKRSPSGRQLVQRRLDWNLLFRPRRAVLELDRAGGEAARAEDELPG